MSGAPASTLIPPAFERSNVPDFVFQLKDLPSDDKGLKFFLASAFTRGFRYFTENGDIRLSLAFPEDFTKDIGYKYGHGPGKTDKDGNPKLERSYPSEIWLARAWVVEQKRMVALIIHSPTVMKRLAKLMRNEEYLMLAKGICNFYLTLFRDENAKSPSDTYDVTTEARVLRNDQAYTEAAKPWHPERYFRGLNPFEADPEPPSAATPATVRDENGADLDIEMRKEDDADW